MGWTFPWASSFGSDFNYDFQAAMTEKQQLSGAVEYNFRVEDRRLEPEADKESQSRTQDVQESNDVYWGGKISPVGTDWATYGREMPGMSAFALSDGVVYHSYSTYSRGLDGLWGMYQWLDRAPLGRNETVNWFRRHDEY
jgi:predicted dithiol-disulfide oxidoreductase (DUF899 family)